MPQSIAMTNEDRYIVDYYRDKYKSDFKLFSEKPLYSSQSYERLYVSHDFDGYTGDPLSSINKVSEEDRMIFCLYFALEAVMGLIVRKANILREERLFPMLYFCGHGLVGEYPWSIFTNSNIKAPDNVAIKIAATEYLHDLLQQSLITDIDTLKTIIQSDKVFTYDEFGRLTKGAFLDVLNNAQ